MQLPWMLGFLASLLLTPTVGDSDRDKLQGNWQCENMVRGGEKAPEQDIKSTSLTVQGERWSVMIGGREEKGKFMEDATKKPKEITFTSDDGTERKGVYEVEGDTLKICVSEPSEARPTELDSKAGSTNIYFVFKRKK
jgi:uncharacterized protein (TIGR03067 family)